MSDEQVPPQPPEPPPPPPPAAAPPPPAPGGASENRGIMIILSYLWLLALIPLLVEKGDREVQWHAKHGLILTVAEFVVWLAMMILSVMLTAIFAPIGCLFTLLYLALALGIVIFHVMCMVKGVNGERLKLPVVSDYAERI